MIGILVDTRNYNTVWADSYDRDFTDIFAIKSDIAQKVASMSVFNEKADVRGILAAFEALPSSMKDDPAHTAGRIFFAIYARDFAATAFEQLNVLVKIPCPLLTYGYLKTCPGVGSTAEGPAL